MRQARFKVKGTAAVYHCMSRTVAGEMWLDEVAKEMFRKMLWKVADFSGVEVLGYCVMTNHFHLLVRVPEKQVVDRAELLRRYAVLYHTDVPIGYPDLAGLKLILEGDDLVLAEAWTQRLLARMGDVSAFMKTLKQRYTIWYNRSRNRFGTIWAERFKSVLVQNTPAVLKTVAAYIDLNPVRAKMVTNPGDYRWSSYGEAMGGRRLAQKGLAQVMGCAEWSEAGDAYRVLLFGKGGRARRREQGEIPADEVQRVLQGRGKLPVAELLHFRLRYMTDGGILGSAEFVRAMGAKLLANGETAESLARKRLGKVPLAVEAGESADGDGGALTCLRCLRRSPVE